MGLAKTIRYGLLATASIIIFSSGPIARAGETHFGVDSSYDLDQLAHSRDPLIRTWEDHGVYRSDASWVVNADSSRLLAVSLDYNNYGKGKDPVTGRERM